MIENEMTVSVSLEVVKASEIEPKEVKWLWYPYIPFGKVTLLQGDPGDGKSKLNIVLPKTVQLIDKQGFSDCRNLSCIELNNVKNIKEKAFENCISLQTLFSTQIRINPNPKIQML